MSSAQEKEFALFGFINTRLRAGLIIGLLSLSITGNVFLTLKVFSVQNDLYEKMLQRVDAQVDKKVSKKLDEPVKQIKAAIARVDTSTALADSASIKALNK